MVTQVAHTETDIWKDPRLIDALKDGRNANDIMLLRCPLCLRFGYYNEGSHFTCLFCDVDFYALSEDERTIPGIPCVQAEEAVRIADTIYDGGGL